MSAVAEHRRPRVALVTHEIHDGGGMERACAELIRRAHRDVDFLVVSTALAPDLRPLVTWRRVAIRALPFSARFVLFFVIADLRLRGLRADIVHTTGSVVPSPCALCSVHFCHAGYAGRRTEPAMHASLARRLNGWLARRAFLAAERWYYRAGRVRRFAAVSEGLRAELEEHYPGTPIALTPNGVDHERFAPDARVRREVRAEEGARDEELVAVFVGGDWDRKGLGIAIDAVARASAPPGPPMRLWVVGGGDVSRMRRRAEASGVAARVTFFGVRRDTQRYLQAADVFVLPTAYETFGLAALEAAACGLPVLSVAGVSGVEDIVGRRAGGMLLRRSADDFARALRELATDPFERRRMGREARSRSLRYTWSSSVESVLELYREAGAAIPVGRAASR